MMKLRNIRKLLKTKSKKLNTYKRKLEALKGKSNCVRRRGGRLRVNAKPSKNN